MVDVLMIGVVVLELLLGVEAVDALPRESCSRDPVAPVRAGIVIKQQLLEVRCPVAPVNSQIKNEVAGDILPAAVAHPASLLELAHVRVYKRVTRAPIFPALQGIPASGPRRLVSCDAPSHKDLVPIAVAHVDKEVPPCQLEDQPVGGLVLDTLSLVALRLPPDAPWREAPMRQPGAELRGVPLAEHAVPDLEVLLELVILEHPLPHPLHSGHFTALEAHHAARVVLEGSGRLLGRVAQLLQGRHEAQRLLQIPACLSLRQLWQRRQPLGRVERLADATAALGPVLEGGEEQRDVVRRTAAVLWHVQRATPDLLQ
mmetsp:Transcript_65298/g.174053  ORF Transcript_65298/g.174053 Transcript_65298/m.174053 type:complete len:315 (-) Transcript_65298:445-1389(-)